MKLTPLGAQAAQFGQPERKALGTKIVKGEDIAKYTTGVCYEAAAFVRFLLGTKIKPNDLLTVNGTAWLQKLAFDMTKFWDGKTAFTPGVAVGFFRLADKKIFHVGIASGSAKIRAVNGHLLGNGWHEVDLKHVLGAPDEHREFTYDRTAIKVVLGTV